MESTISELIEDYGGLLSSMGEENIVALPLNLEDSHLIANMLLDRFISTPFDFGKGEFYQGVSLGTSTLKYCYPKTFRRLIELASGALVYSKKHGKGRVSIFGDK